MDIHRSRFVPYPPSAINALAFSASDNKRSAGKNSLRLAIGRANGNIEIWNPARGAWVHETTLYGGRDRSVEGLTWIQEPDEKDADGKYRPGRLRLFSIGHSSTVTEWDLVKGLPLRNSSGNYSEVWCLASQPRWQHTKQDGPSTDEEFRGQNLAIGCADGTIAVLYTGDGELRFQRFLSRPTEKKARVLSITFQNRHTVVAGLADSTIRVLDARNGTSLRNISLGAGPMRGLRERLVWTVKCLPNGDLVAGDSTGEVTFFDGRNYSQLQRISGHEADVLDLAVSNDGQMVFSGGMDCRTVAYRLEGSGGSKRARWARISHTRYHEHDVKAMATFEGSGKGALSVVVSGGPDAAPVVVPIRQFGSENYRTLPALPQRPPTVSAPGQRLFVTWWDRDVRIWHVRKRSLQDDHPKLVAHLTMKTEENISSASISQDGSILAVATAAEVKLFRLSLREGDKDRDLRIRKMDGPQHLSKQGARIVHISPDGKWLAVIRHDNSPSLFRLKAPEAGPKSGILVPKGVRLSRLPRKATPSALNGFWGSYDRTITETEFSTDSRVFVVADLSGSIDSWILEGFEDITAPEVDVAHAASSASSSDSESDEDENEEIVVLFGQHWIRNPAAQLLPRLESAPILLSFRPPLAEIAKPLPNGNPAVHPTRNHPHRHSHELPHGTYRLFVVTAQHGVYEFNILDGRLTEWSRRNPTAHIPVVLRNIRDRVMGCLWDRQGRDDRIWLYGSSWLFMLNVSQDLPKPEDLEDSEEAEEGNEVTINGHVFSKKRKRDANRQRPTLQQPASGAGSKIPESELVGLGRKMRKIADGEAATVELDAEPSPELEAVEDDEDQPEFSVLSALNNNNSKAHGMANGTATEDEGDARQRPGTRNWWCTFKYRPILGMVPISTPGGEPANDVREHDTEVAADDEILEVVLVERPSWDLDLPPRFFGNHER